MPEAELVKTSFFLPAYMSNKNSQKTIQENWSAPHASYRNCDFMKSKQINTIAAISNTYISQYVIFEIFSKTIAFFLILKIF